MPKTEPGPGKSQSLRRRFTRIACIVVAIQSLLVLGWYGILLFDLRNYGIDTVVEVLDDHGELDRCDASPETWRFPADGEARLWAFRDDGTPFNSGVRQTSTAPATTGRPRGVEVTYFGGQPGVVYETGRKGACHRLFINVVPTVPFAESIPTRLLWWLAFDLLAILGLSTWLAVPLIRRIRQLAHKTRDVVENEFDGQVPVEPDELGELVSAFNDAAAAAHEMVSTLQGREETLRRAMADLAHDVRTPLSSLKLCLSRLESADDEGPAVMRAEVEYLDGLFANVASQAQLESDALELLKRPVDACQLVQQIGLRFELLAQDRGVTLDVSIPNCALFVEGDPVLLAQAVTNVVHNAVKFAASSVTMWALRRDEIIEIGILDNGPGISTIELPRVVERYFQGERRIVADGPSPRGLGLGLSITRTVLARHGGTFELERSAEGGTLARLQLPRRPL